MGKVAEIKTKENNSSVEDFVNAIKDEQMRKDSFKLVTLMKKATKETPKMWGSSLIGFGNKRYKSPTSGREVDWFKIGFAPRKPNLSLHLVLDLRKHANTLKRLGKHKAGLGCLYVNKLADVDVDILQELITIAAAAK